jgi:hypothetical protein
MTTLTCGNVYIFVIILECLNNFLFHPKSHHSFSLPNLSTAGLSFPKL